MELVRLFVRDATGRTFAVLLQRHPERSLELTHNPIWRTGPAVLGPSGPIGSRPKRCG